MTQELCARGEVVGDHVDLHLKLGEEDIGTLHIALDDYPAMAALLKVGTDLLRMPYDYTLDCGRERWREHADIA